MQNKQNDASGFIIPGAWLSLRRFTSKLSRHDFGYQNQIIIFILINALERCNQLVL